MASIHSISGELSREDAGFILPHEHLLWNQIRYAEPEPDDDEGRRRRVEKMSLWNRGAVIMNPFSFLDDLVMESLDGVLDDVTDYKRAGGGTIFEVSPRGFGRDPDVFYELSQKTGVHIVFGSSNYIEAFMTEEDRNRSADGYYELTMSEFENGVGERKLKPGIVGEVGLTSLDRESELNSLRGATRAHREIGCTLMIHPPLFTDKGEVAQCGLGVLDIVEEEGGDVEKTVLCHNDLNFFDIDYLVSLLKRGCVLEFDQMGMHLMSFKSMPGKFLPCDLDRINSIRQLVDRGFGSQIIISQDVCYKHLLKKWGGFGYSHILENIIPMMIHYGGIDKEIVHQITFENPFRILSW